MKEIGIRDLKSHLTSIIRAVREESVEYTVTLHGKPVAVIRPYTPAEEANQRNQQIADELAQLDRLAEAIGKEWTIAQSGAEILEELREESACR